MFKDVLLTVDYDRTLTDPNSEIPERNIRAIEYFMANGGTFTVNTGRGVPAIASFRNKVPVNAPYLVYNGAAFYDVKTDKLSNCCPIDMDGGALIAHLQEKFPEMTVEIQGISGGYAMAKNPDWERYCDHNQYRWAYTTPEELEKPFLKFAIYGKFLSERVASLYEATEEEMRQYDEVVRYVLDYCGGKVDFFRACARLIDFQAKGVSKITAARKLQQDLGKKILVCVGDAENDVAMLSGADYAYCPADGVVADWYENVCNCADGAVADVIYKKIPEILGLTLDIKE